MNNLTRIKEEILDLIFPKFCVGCKKEGEWVCKDCSDNILSVVTQTCPECGRISKGGQYCSSHQYIEVPDPKKKGKKLKRRRPLEGIIVSAYYEEGPIKEMIHNFKYNHVMELGEVLGEIMAKALRNNLSFFNGRIKNANILVTAVPLHFLRRAQRGYNQSEILAENVADKINLKKNFKILQKFRKTKTQVKYSGKKRRENLKNSFKMNDKLLSVIPAKAGIQSNILKNRTIVLVDDVTTTGTTLNECAKVLRAAGAKRVWGLVIAKG